MHLSSNSKTIPNEMEHIKNKLLSITSAITNVKNCYNLCNRFQSWVTNRLSGKGSLGEII